MLIKLLALLLLVFAAPAFANTANPDGFDEWLASFKERASRSIPADEVERALAGVRFIPAIVELDRRQPEFAISFHRYYHNTVTQARIQRGREMLRTHAAILDEVSQRYGVQPHIIMALWGMETNFGGFMGVHRTVDGLATMAFDPRRSAFFTEQLMAAVRIIAAGHKTPDSRGSWAGAFGHFQFMPTTFERYAVDGDGDGRIDFFNSMPDSFASASNYLSRLGWNGRQRWGRPVRLARDTDELWAQVNSFEQLTVREFSRLGVVAHDGSRLPNSDMMGMLIAPNGARGPMFLVYNNFNLIMRWNAAQSYALAVGLLADHIAGAGVTLEWPEGADEPPLSFEQIRGVQRRLQELGLFDANLTGRLGRQTMRGVKAYQNLLLAGDRRVSPDGTPIRYYASGRRIRPDGHPTRDTLVIMGLE